jgi:hypothetical protein
MDPTLLQTLEQLFTALGQLVVQLLSLAIHWVFLLLWLSWWLLAVNWQRAWPVLRMGGWAPVVLLALIAALTWSRLQPVPCECLGVVTIPNFWWQLGYVAMLVAIALFCGWLQGVMRWAPAEISLEPPAHSHGENGHAAHH